MSTTVASQGWDVPLQPGFGSQETVKEEERTPLQIWTHSNGEWATTPHTKTLLQLCETEDWSTEEEARDGILAFLHAEPVSHDELRTTRERLQEVETENSQIVQEALHSIGNMA